MYQYRKCTSTVQLYEEVGVHAAARIPEECLRGFHGVRADRSKTADLIDVVLGLLPRCTCWGVLRDDGLNFGDLTQEVVGLLEERLNL